LQLPERHLGLVQVEERADIETFIANAARLIAGHCDVDAINAAFQPLASGQGRTTVPNSPGGRIAIARDVAFSFIYPHLLTGWRDAGAELSFFSPLADETPAADCDAIYLPGGYPELHAGKIAAANNFLSAIRRAAKTGAIIYGECGGYMVLGEGIEDEKGQKHAMCGLLALETSFLKRKLHLGYRKLQSLTDFHLGKKLTAHEFHYSSALREEGEPLFAARDANGELLGNFGLRSANVMGSYMHVIDRLKS
jgi:cobyrinic acid a,c-diamide synthase